MNQHNPSRTPAAPVRLGAALWRGVQRSVQRAARSSRGLAALLLLVAAAADVRAASSEPWPEIPLPPKAKVEWVADSMRVNGVPTRVLHFHSQVSRSELVEYYRAYWSGGYPTKPSVRALGDATVVGQAHGPYFMTVKVKDGANESSEGLIAVSLVVGTKIDRSAGPLPLMPGAKVLSVVESNDPGRRSREVLVLAAQAPASVLQYYQMALQNAGWRPIQLNQTPRTPGSAGGSFAVFQREHSELQLSITDSPKGQGSLLVANLVTKGTGPQPF